ncbi:hypothetical protein MKX03_027066 [Papaver bracteatum]|nr:hypothetical protein MKX03_027066 [Papaver bracteatum]
MGKISIFLGCFLLFLIAMPAATSSSRMMLEKDVGIEKCPPRITPSCDFVQCQKPANCPKIRCGQGLVLYQPCCDCPSCCSKSLKLMNILDSVLF